MIKDYIAFDLETTGLNVETDEIIEIGALKVRNGKVCDRFMEFLKPSCPITPMITNITGITNEMVSSARETKAVLRDFVSFCGEDVLLGHNIMFDYKFIKKYANGQKLPFEKYGIDTLQIARKVHKDLESRSLESLCQYYQIENKAAHRAYHDALATAKLYHTLAHVFESVDAEIFKPKQLVWRVKKTQPCTKKQILFLQALCKQHQIPMIEQAEELSRSEMSRRIDAIISTYGNL